MITTLYERECRNERNDMHTHLPTFVWWALALRAQTVVELGVRGGISTLGWLHAMELTGGHLWSVDIDPPPPLESGHWTFLQGNDTHPSILGQLPDTFDILFIDTSHAYDHTLTELILYGARVRPGGAIFLHDTELEWPFADYPDLHEAHPEQYPVKRAITDYCLMRGWSWSNDERCFGLGRIDVTR